MLKNRVLTALALLPLIVGLVYHGGWPFRLLILVCSGIALREFFDMTLRYEPWWLRVLGVAFGLWASFRVAVGSGDGGAALLGVEAVLATAVVLIFLIKVIAPGDDLESAVRTVSLALFGLIYAGVLLALIGRLRDLPGGFGWVIFIFATTWGNDTGAYFAGRRFGRHKLHPRVSPNKTWEGFAGGMVSTVLAGYLVAWLLLPEVSAGLIFLAAAPCGILGPVGDLAESMLKRAYGVKDSGQILPGHGGMLDRIDALIFNLPWVCFCAAL